MSIKGFLTRFCISLNIDFSNRILWLIVRYFFSRISFKYLINIIYRKQFFFNDETKEDLFCHLDTLFQYWLHIVTSLQILERITYNTIADSWESDNQFVMVTRKVMWCSCSRTQRSSHKNSCCLSWGTVYKIKSKNYNKQLLKVKPLVAMHLNFNNNHYLTLWVWNFELKIL